MSRSLRKTRRDILFSLSNSAPFDHAADWARLANCWRTTGDILDQWIEDDNKLTHFGVSEIAFSQDRWMPFAAPGHWNDPDMLVVGYVGWGPKLHETKLTHDEQLAHLSMWCLLSAPLLIGCDLERLDDFTSGLLSNDEVLALDQDSSGHQAVRVASIDAVDIFMKSLEDGGTALGFFNRGRRLETVKFTKLPFLGLRGTYKVRDLWRHEDRANAKTTLSVSVEPHGVVLLRLTPVRILP